MAMYKEHDDRLRQFLDQRTTTGNHGRFPSLSERSDSPSVYSRANFSPYQLDKDELEANTRAFDFHIPEHLQSSARRPPSMAYDRDGLDDDPSSSSLDFRNSRMSPRSSFDSSHPYDNDDPEPILPPEDSPEEPDEEDGAEPRMSLLGPKIAFHSRAPWETGEDALLEEDESDSGNSKAPSIFNRGRHLAAKKGLGLSPAHRAHSAVRPSEDSSLSPSSFPRPHRGLESSASTGALHALAQASISSSAFSTASSKQSRSGGRSHKVSDASQASRSQPPSNYHSMPSSPQATSASSPNHFQYHVSAASPPGVGSASPTTDLSRPYSTAQSTHTRASEDSWVDLQHPSHPYANPEFANSFASPLRKGFAPQNVNRGDSVATLTDGPSKSRPSSPTSSMRPSIHVNRKEISSPVSVKTSTLRTNDTSLPPPSLPQDAHALQPPTPNTFPGWQENASPAVTLISLAEAQALARERSRSATVNAGSSQQRPPFLDGLATSTSSSSGLTSQSSSGRSRVRSESAGPAKSKTPTPTRQDSDEYEQSGSGGSLGKGLKHKKSGFMRIFNGAKERDRERNADRSPQPQAPPMSDSYFYPSGQVKAHKMQQIGTPVSPHPPQLSPPKLDDSSSAGSFLTSDLSSNSMDSGQLTARTPEREPSRRLGAPLSIKTPEPRFSPKPPDSRSAPPGQTDFPALKLRPVSTLFSAHFANHIVENPGKTIIEEDELDASGSFSEGISPGTGNSPMTPGFPSRGPSEGDSTPAVSGGDQSSVIQALHEQIASSRKMWQRQLWDLEGQVRDLKQELEDLRGSGRGADVCDVCGRGGPQPRQVAAEALEARKKQGVSVVHRPRARTGDAARFGAGV